MAAERTGLDTDGQEAQRQRVRWASLVLLVGVAILLATLGMAIVRGPFISDEAVAADGATAPTPVDSKTRAQALTIMIVYGAVLLVVFVVAAVALVVASRGYRRRLLARSGSDKGEPTPTDDIWSQHKLPEEASGQETSADNGPSP